MRLDINVHGLFTWIGVLCASLLFDCVQGVVNEDVCQYRRLERPGSLVIKVLADIHEPGIDGRCSRHLAPTAVERLVSLDWAVEIVNGRMEVAGPLIHGNTIGYTIYDTCGSDDRTVDILYENQNDCDLPAIADNTITIGLIAQTNVDVTDTVSRLMKEVPVIRPLPSSSALNTVDQPNLFTTTVPFQFEAMALVRLLLHYDWNFVVLLHEDTVYGEKMTSTFLHLASLYDICVNYTGLPTQQSKEAINAVINTLVWNKTITVVYLGHDGNLLPLFENTNDNTRPFGSTINWVFGTAHTGTLPFTNTLMQAGNDNIISLTYESGVYNIPFGDYFSLMFTQPLNASHPLYSILKERSDEDGFINGDWDPRHVMDAVFTLVEATRKTLHDACQTQNISTCFPGDFYARTVQNIKNIEFNVTNYLLDLDGYPYSSSTITMQSNGHVQHEDLKIKLRLPTNEIRYPAVYNLHDELIIKSPPVSLPPSVCKSYCPTCFDSDKMRFSYLHGDVLILGLFSIRQYGDSIFSCGRLRHGTNDIITVSAFMFSVMQKRKETGIKFGAIAIDDCYNGVNTHNYLSELFNKRKFIKDPNTQAVVDFSKVISVVGAISSSVSLQIGDLMTSLRIPMISYGASSPELDEENRYPFFLRTVPSDTLQVKGMITLLSVLKVTHVGLIYLDDAYGRAGKRRLLEAAIEKNICVKDPIRVTQDMSDGQTRDVINALFNQQVRVVLYFSIDSIAQRLLGQLDSMDTEKPLMFLASDGWGTNQHLVDGEIGFRSHGSLIFTVGFRNYYDPGDVYKEFLLNLNLTSTDNNRWIPNYFEDFNQCNLKTSYEKYSTTPQRSICVDNSINTKLDQSTVDSLYTDQRAVHTKIAVYAATEGYKQYCSNTAGCTPMRARDDISAFVGEIKTRTIDGSSIFDGTGNGNIGFDIHNIQIVNRRASYVKIGTYQTLRGLEILSAPKFYNTYHQEVSLNSSSEYSYFINCRHYPGACLHVCKIPSTTISSTQPSITKSSDRTPEPDKQMTTVTVILGVLLAGVLVVLVILMCVVIRMYRQQTQKMSEISASAGFSSAGSVIQDEYDTPSSLANKSVCSFAFVNNDPSVQTDMASDGHVHYSDVQAVQHLRQHSNQELGTDLFCADDHRPLSALSAPVGALTPARKRANKIKTETFAKYCSKTPNSAPIKLSIQGKARPEGTSSLPRFLNVGTRSFEESLHYNLPNDASYDDPNKPRRFGVSEDSLWHDEQLSPHTRTPESYLEPNVRQTDSTGNESENGHTITYLTSKDLFHSDSEESEDPEEITQTVCSVPPRANNDHAISTGCSVISPTDKEVMDINYSSSHKSHDNLQNKPLNNDGSKRPNIGGRPCDNNSHSVPDIIKHGFPLSEEDGVFII